MAIQEMHTGGKISWPGDARIAVLLSFDFQGGEDVRPDKNGKMNHEEYTQAEYGPNTGIWRILRILASHEVKATFLTCGGIAERYPEAVAAIVAAGHEVAGHGYHHEVARDLSRDEERDVMKRTTDMILNRAQKRPVGWRSCTQSPNSIELLMEQGYLWNSNSFSHDLPFVWQNGKKKLVELPRQPFGDGRTYGHRDSGNPNDTLAIWKGDVRSVLRRIEPGADVLSVPVSSVYLEPSGPRQNSVRYHRPYEVAKRRVVCHRQRDRPLVAGEGILGRGQCENLEGGVRNNGRVGAQHAAPPTPFL